MMEARVSQSLAAPNFTGFEEYQTIRLSDEVADQIKFFQWKLNWAESFYDAYKADAEGVSVSTLPRDVVWEKYSMYKEEVAKDKEMLEHLDAIDDQYPELFNEVSFTIYKLTYLGVDASGNKVHDNCYGRFDKNGNMVAFKLADGSDWEILGNYWSTPGFYELVSEMELSPKDKKTLFL